MDNIITTDIDRLKIYAHHGVLDQERRVGNMFEVSLRLCCDATDAVCSDNLEGTVNYAEVIQEVELQMNTPSQLLEHVAGRIRQALTARFPMIKSGTVKVTKITPPVSSQLASVSVSLSW